MRLKHILSVGLLLAILIVYQGCNNEEGNVTPTPGVLQLSTLRIGTYSINLSDFTKNTAAPIDKPIVATFSATLDTASARQHTQLRLKGGDLVPLKFSYLDNNKTFSAIPKIGLLSPN